MKSYVRGSWPWAAVLSTILLIRYLFDTLNPPTDYRIRAAVLTYGIFGLCSMAGFLGALRTRSVSGGATLALSAATTGALLSIVGTTVMLAIWHDPATLEAWERSGGLQEAFFDVPIKLVAIGAVLGIFGGLVGKGVSRALLVALSVAFGVGGAACSTSSPGHENASAVLYSSQEMPDGRHWTTNNLSVNTDGAFCYEDAELSCRRYGRLYTWEAARRACQTLGNGWRLPTDDDWRQLARHYGGVFEDSTDSGKAAYTALLYGGRSGFLAQLGGGRQIDGKYARLEAHGFYWTASESSPGTAWFYNFGKGSLALYRQREGEKQMAISVRCIKD